MSEIILQIDGKEVKAREGMTLLEAAQNMGILIPTLCHHEKLEPYGACRICIVEVDVGGRENLAAACVRPVEQNMVVRTRSEKVDKIRKILIEQFLAHAPDSEVLLDLAKDYGADRDRFKKQSSFCILCGLCVRYCTEVKKKNAIGFFDRGATREIRFIPEVASKECENCKECFPLCPTSYLQAAYHLTEAIAFPSSSFKPASEELA
jgi:bidirectional [NiFe] hydrogenase diaphorase subunit